MIAFLLLGLAGGLIVSSWQGFKDPPWEGFSLAKFIRSPLIGAAAGVAAFWLDAHTAVLRADNAGLVMLAALAMERLTGEIYKGFLRPGFHAEYVRLFERVGFPMQRTMARACVGAALFAGGLALYWSLGRLAAVTLAAWDASTASALAIGSAVGTIVAAGGALKDSQFEGFKPAKFVRSPIMSMLGARLIVAHSTDPLLIALATIGSERVAVEFYKTFLMRQVRGIHAHRPVLHPEWFGRRWLFAVAFLAGVSVCVWLTAAS